MCHNEEFIVRWAHFCVSFVEVFSDVTHADAYLDGANGLNVLQRLQHEATVEELVMLFDGHVDKGTLEYFSESSCG